MDKQEYQFADRHVLESSEAMNALRKQKDYVDMTIFCSGKDISAHRFILASASPFFERALIEDSKINEFTVIEVENVKPHIMELVLEFMYVGEVNVSNESFEEGFDLLLAASYMELDDLVTGCVNKLLQRDPDTALDMLWEWSEKTDSQLMRNLIIEFLAKEGDRLTNYKVFLEMPLAAAMATLDKVPHPQAEALLTAIVTWIKHDLPNRQRHLMELTSKIPFELLPATCLNSLAANLPTIKTLPKFQECMNLVGLKECDFATDAKHETKNFHSPTRPQIIEVHPAEATFKTACTPRIASPRPGAKCPHKVNPLQKSSEMFTVLGNNIHNQLVMTSCTSNHNKFWTDHNKVGLRTIQGAAYASLGDNLVIIGGEAEDETKLNTTYMYNMTWKTLSDGPELRLSRSGIGVAAQDDLLYLFGGTCKRGQVLQYVEVLNIAMNRFDLLPSLQYKHLRAPGAVINNRLYVIGGGTFQCESIYPQRPEGGWCTMEPLPEMLATSNLHVATYDLMVYAFRDERISHVYCFNPIRNQWKSTKVMGHLPETIAGLCSGKGYEVYGIDKNGLVFTFDIRNSTWDLANHVEIINSIEPLYMTVQYN